MFGSKGIFLVVLFVHTCLVTRSLSDSTAKPSNEIIVTTDVGKIRGVILNSTAGRSFYAFRGVRYAKPPIGTLRFQSPEPIEGWHDVFDATQDGPKCPQPARGSTDISEDCLRINIYTHAIRSNHQYPTEKKPVIVYFHPGGFYSVSGQSYNYAGPYYFMDRDIVLVTINYRLGALGFLSTGTVDAPGNAGLKDQVMALKWVQSNIHNFGGDSNSVTLLGYSAGAMSITLHMISPMSKNLFHKAIVMSGSAAAQWDLPSNQLDLAERQARLLKCPDDRISEMIECLKTKNAIEMGESLEDMFDLGRQPIILFKPVIEPDFGQERFLIEDPIQAFQKGNFNRIPIIAGITKDEFAGPAIRFLKNDTLLQILDSNFTIWAPVNFLYERNTERSERISRKLRETYLGDDHFTLNKSLEGLVKLFADGVIGYGMNRFIHLSAKYTKVYQYRFSYQGRYSHTYYPDNKTPYGVVHHDDLLYLFTVSPDFVPVFTEKDPERKTVERMTRMWTNFASSGMPINTTDTNLKDVQWKPFTPKDEEYLDIGEVSLMKNHLYADRYKIWENLFPLDVSTNS